MSGSLSNISLHITQSSAIHANSWNNYRPDASFCLQFFLHKTTMNCTSVQHILQYALDIYVKYLKWFMKLDFHSEVADSCQLLYVCMYVRLRWSMNLFLWLEYIWRHTNAEAFVRKVSHDISFLFHLADIWHVLRILNFALRQFRNFFGILTKCLFIYYYAWKVVYCMYIWMHMYALFVCPQNTFITESF